MKTPTYVPAHGLLAGRSVLITAAAGGGIGFAAARRCLEEGARALMLSDFHPRRTAEAAEALGKEFPQQTVLGRVCNVAVEADVQALVEAAEAELGGVDVLINNAGLALGMNDLKDGDPADWDTMIDTNIKGLLYMTREALRGMSERNSGHIVNVGSIAGTAAYAKGAVYCATKAAVRFISDALRQEVVATGIRVTNVQPGMVETNFSNVRFKGDEAKAGDVYKGIDALTPEDIAETIAYVVLAPENVQVSEVTVMPTHQAGPGVVHRKS